MDHPRHTIFGRPCAQDANIIGSNHPRHATAQPVVLHSCKHVHPATACLHRQHRSNRLHPHARAAQLTPTHLITPSTRLLIHRTSTPYRHVHPPLPLIHNPKGPGQSQPRGSSPSFKRLAEGPGDRQSGAPVETALQIFGVLKLLNKPRQKPPHGQGAGKVSPVVMVLRPVSLSSSIYASMCLAAQLPRRLNMVSGQ
jgi:hypothetical protein